MSGAALGLFSGVVPLLLALVGGGLGLWLFAGVSNADDLIAAQFRTRLAAVKERVEELQRSAPAEKLLRAKAQALDALNEYNALSAAYGQAKADYDRQRHQRQLDNHLASYPVRGAAIAKLLSADLAGLASYGIATAFDAKRRDIRQVYGIGPVKAGNIADWVRRLEARFHFQSAYSEEDQRLIRQAQSAIVQKQQGAEERIKRLIEELRTEARTFERWRQTQDPELTRRCLELAQAEADLRYANLPVPGMPPFAPALLPSVESFRRSVSTAPGPFPASAAGGSPRAAAGAVLCPRCQGVMIRRVARRGTRAGKPFWGCKRYPSCTGTRPI
ncbi:hypothetical protein [uncultured Enterovirga sp.]|uniref:hypothetical protein n=1 Tax=uncultured Enterovirga sp. TaxID=2026352 RepID=UPI0035CA1E27